MVVAPEPKPKKNRELKTEILPVPTMLEPEVVEPVLMTALGKLSVT
jgi:hypothetical protein